MISTQQIIVMIPLFDIDRPSSTDFFFQWLFTVAAGDFIPDEWMEALFQSVNINKTDALTDNFETLGFESTVFLYNLGSMSIIMSIFPTLMIVGVLLKLCRDNQPVRLTIKKIEGYLYWPATI